MFKIAEFLNTNAACETIWNETGWLPSRKSFIETVDADQYPGLSFYLVDIEETTDWLRGGRRCPIHWFVTSAFSELREAVYRGNMTADEAAAELQQRAVDEWEAQDLG
jgi:ABC-type glycerol-3-phosphate transport system substrate-binding protein